MPNHLQQLPWGYNAKWNKQDRERQILGIITLLWNLNKKWNSQKQRVESGCQGVGDRDNKEKLVKGNKYSFIRWIRSEDLMYDTMTIADNTVLYD